jgi:hypothetical protein
VNLAFAQLTFRAVTSYNYTLVTATVGNTTTAVYTNTVPTPSGFVPVYDSSGNSNFNGGSKRDAEVDLEDGTVYPRQVVTPPDMPAPTSYPFIYSIVTRLQPRTTSTVIIFSTHTSTQRPPATITQSSTRTVTSTYYVPDQPVNSTLIQSFSTTQDVNQTITVQAPMTVSTVTVNYYNYTSTTKTYAACATNNLLGPRLSGGNYIQALYDNTPSNVGQGTKASSSYECCTIW